MDQGHGVSVVKGEVSLLLSATRRISRWAGHGRTVSSIVFSPITSVTRSHCHSVTHSHHHTNNLKPFTSGRGTGLPDSRTLPASRQVNPDWPLGTVWCWCVCETILCDRPIGWHHRAHYRDGYIVAGQVSSIRINWWVTPSQHHTITASHHHSITLWQHHSITLSQHHTITVSHI